MSLKVEQLWFRFFNPKIDTLSLAYFRISLGAISFVLMIFLFSNWQKFYADNGVLSLNSIGQPQLFDSLSLFSFFGSDGGVYFVWILGLISALTFTIGLWTRGSNLVLFVILSSMINRNWVVTSGEECVLVMWLFPCLFLPLNQQIAMDQKFQSSKQVSSNPVGLWPVRLMQIQFVMIYALSLPAKLSFDPAWLRGDFMYYLLNSPVFSRFPWPTLTYSPYISELLTYSSLVFEFCVPFLIWFRKTRNIILVAIVIFHVLLAIFLKNVGFFSLTMISGTILFGIPWLIDGKRVIR